MKIIGKTEGGFILEASKTECQKLANVEWRHSFEIGDEIPLGDLFEYGSRMQRLREKATSAAGTLRQCLETLESDVPDIHRIVVENEVKDGEVIE